MAVELSAEVNSITTDTAGLRLKCIALREIVKEFPGYVEHYWGVTAYFDNPATPMWEFSIGTSQRFKFGAYNYYGSWSLQPSMTGVTSHNLPSVHVGSHIGRLVYNPVSAMFYLEKDGLPDSFAFGKTLDDTGTTWIIIPAGSNTGFYRNGLGTKFSGNPFGSNNYRTPDGKLLVIPCPPMIESGSTVVHESHRLANLSWCGTLDNAFYRYDGNLFRVGPQNLLKIQ